MDELEKYIGERRNELDLDSPREGHEARFLKRLEKPVRKMPFRHVIQIAASVAIILASSVVLIRRDDSGSRVPPDSAKAAATVSEAEIYYARQVDQKFDVIRSFSFDEEEEKNVLLDELKDLDALHEQLLNDLEANPGDERVINALIRHYQIKLEVMDQIIIQLNQLGTETENQNENESI